MRLDIVPGVKLSQGKDQPKQQGVCGVHACDLSELKTLIEPFTLRTKPNAYSP
jgi:hypothetical protein